ncbi:MAG: glycosyltransferase, partial [Chloroflexota bacterium]
RSSGVTERNDTPPEWRAIAAATLAGGAAIGWRAGRGGVLGGLAIAGAAAAAVSAARMAAASRNPPLPPSPAPVDAAASPPTFTIVIAARDEAAALPRLIADIGAQDHRTDDGRPEYELIVIDDRSTDGTPQAALRAASNAGLGDVTRLVRRNGADLPDGKGAALTAAPPETYRGDVVVVLDADARVGASFLSTLARYVAAGAPALTARRRVLDAASSHLAGAQADEQTVDGELQRGRWALGGASEFRGNGIVVRRDLLLSVGGWRAEALTEDIDLSSRIAAECGVTVAWAIDAEVWEEPVRTWPDLWRQRVRWAEGAVRRALEHGPAVLRSDRLSTTAKADFAVYAAQLAAPPVIAGALARGAVAGRWRVGALLLAAYAATAAALGFDALRWEHTVDGSPLSTGERAGRAARLAAFGVVWLAAVPAALWRLASRRGAMTYHKMAHDGGGEPIATAGGASAASRSGAGSAAALPR